MDKASRMVGKAT